MTRQIDYGNLMHTAMRGLIKTVLQDVAANGLPGKHHFFITFDTAHPDAELADWLSDRYPGEMTIVVQHWFDNLTITDEGFSITLNFGDSPEPLYIPFDAIVTFVDPSVEFGLRFESGPHEDGEPPPDPTTRVKAVPQAEPKLKPAAKPDAQVVRLDTFRK